MSGQPSLKISMSRQQVEGMFMHSLLETTVTGDQLFCAYSHCRGQCGYPALFLREYVETGTPQGDYYRQLAEQGMSGFKIDDTGKVYRDYKAHGSMVACGPVWQMKAWDGERVYLDTTNRDVSKLLQWMWW